jgi:hypothetical protein
MTTGTPAPENRASIIAVEPKRHTRSYTLPVEACQDVIFVASRGVDGIWRIDRFNSAFVHIFSAPHRADTSDARYTLPLAFATGPTLDLAVTAAMRAICRW